MACDVAINCYLSHKLVFFHWIQTVWDVVKNWLLRKGSFFQAEKLHQISSSRRGEPMCWQHRRVELGDSLLAGNRLPLEETRTHHSGNRKLFWEKSRQRKQPPKKASESFDRLCSCLPCLCSGGNLAGPCGAAKVQLITSWKVLLKHCDSFCGV